MALIFGFAAAAAAVLALFNRIPAERRDATTRNMRQSAGVMGALVAATTAILDALNFINRVAQPQQRTYSPLRPLTPLTPVEADA